MRRIGRSWERAASGIGRRKLPFALTTGMIAVALALVGLVRLGATWAESSASAWGGGVHMVVYLDPGAGPDEAGEVAAALEALAAVDRAVYVSPGESMVRLEEAFGDHAEALSGVEAALLPASVEITLAGRVPSPGAAEAIEARLAGVEVIEDVEVLGEWIAHLDAAARGLRALGSALFAVAVVASVFVVASALELGLAARRRERSVLEILGASPFAARAPTLIEGGVLGLLGAAGALGITYAGWAVSHEAAAELMARLAGQGEAEFLAGRDILHIALAGLAGGLAGGMLASRRGATA